MNDIKLLAGSLSNDLLRVATLKQRGADVAAVRFLNEAKRWAQELFLCSDKQYIKTIAKHVSDFKVEMLTLDAAETFLMQSVQLQNYALHHK